MVEAKLFEEVEDVPENERECMVKDNITAALLCPEKPYFCGVCHSTYFIANLNVYECKHVICVLCHYRLPLPKKCMYHSKDKNNADEFDVVTLIHTG